MCNKPENLWARAMIALAVMIAINALELTDVVEESLCAAAASITTLELRVRIVAQNLSWDAIVLNHALLREQQEESGALLELLLIGQTFDDERVQGGLESSWPHSLHWRASLNRFVLRASLDVSWATLTAMCDRISITVDVYDRFVVPERDYGIVRSLSPVHEIASKAKFCLTSAPPATLLERQTQAYQFAVCTVIRNEGAYLREWIEWHRLVGVEHFFVYDDNSHDSAQNAVLAHYERERLVTVVRWRSENYWRQLTALNACLLRHGGAARWLAALDVDEFVFGTSAAVRDRAQQALFVDVRAVLETPMAKSADVLRIGWQMFSDVPTTNASSLVTARYEWRGASVLRGVVDVLPPEFQARNETARKIIAGKAIFRPNTVDGMEISHTPRLRASTRVLDVPDDVLVIRHYFMRGGFNNSANRWSDTQNWKLSHLGALRGAFGLTHDVLARSLAAAVQRVIGDVLTTQ